MCQMQKGRPLSRPAFRYRNTRSSGLLKAERSLHIDPATAKCRVDRGRGVDDPLLDSYRIVLAIFGNEQRSKTGHVRSRLACSNESTDPVSSLAKRVKYPATGGRCANAADHDPVLCAVGPRSEERRVGKECR